MIKSLIFLLFIPLLCFGEIIITEVMFNPNGSEYHNEFVEIYNDSDENVDLSSLAISDGEEADFLIPYPDNNDMILKSNSFGLIMDSSYPENSTFYEEIIPDSVLRVIINDGSFGKYGFANGEEETVILFNSENDTVDAYQYTINQDPGFSDEKVSLSSQDDLWSNSLYVNGTPGIKNSVSLKDYDISTQIESFSNNTNYGEMITIPYIIKNNGLKEINSISIKIELDTLTLNSFDYMQNILPNDSIELTFNLNIDFYGSKYFIIESILANDENLSNNIDSSKIFSVYDSNTIILNEFMKNPFNDNCEWIEFFNTSNYAINTRDFAFSDNTKDIINFNQDLEIKSKEYFIVAKDSSIFSAYTKMDTKFVIINPSLPAIANSDGLFLYTNNICVDSIVFDDEWQEEKGKSIEKINYDLSSNNPDNWAISIDNGTPTHTNSIFAPINQTKMKNTIKLSSKLITPNDDGNNDNFILNYDFNLPYIYLSISIYGVSGKKILDICKNKYLNHQGTFIWNCKFNSGFKIPMGAYIGYVKATNNEKLYEFKRVFYIVK